MEDPESISVIRVCDIVYEFPKRRVLRADVRIIGGSLRVWLCVEPEPVSVRTCCMVPSEDVIRVRDPETCRCLVSV